MVSSTDPQMDPQQQPRGRERGIPLDPGSDDDPRPLDEDLDETAVDSAEADRRAAEDGTVGEAHDLPGPGPIGDERA